MIWNHVGSAIRQVPQVLTDEILPKPKDLTGHPHPHPHLPHTNLSCKLSLIEGIGVLNTKAADKKRLVFCELAADIKAPIMLANTTLTVKYSNFEIYNFALTAPSSLTTVPLFPLFAKSLKIRLKIFPLALFGISPIN